MKRQKFNKKLAVNKETIANLNEDVMREVYGGDPPTYSCFPICSKSRFVDSCCICYV